MQEFDAKLVEMASHIQGVVFDVDGVLTDGRITFTDDGRELKSFNVQDGASIKALQAAGIKVAIITGRNSPIVDRRAAELGIDWVVQGASDKSAALDKMITEQQFPGAQVAMAGDDIQDLALFNHPAVSLNVTVANGHPLVKAQAHYITERAGGEGVCVELAWLLLTAQHVWPAE